MKALTPIKRHKAIVSFSKEHHFGLLLVWKIRQGLKLGVDPGRISKYVLYFFREDLQKHFSEEETLLFARLPKNDPLRIQAEKEHCNINSLVKSISLDESNIGLLQQFSDDLEKHIRFEERELFNHLQSELDEKDLAEIGKRFSEAVDVDLNWKDLFWIIEKDGNTCAVTK